MFQLINLIISEMDIDSNLFADWDVAKCPSKTDNIKITKMDKYGNENVVWLN